MMPLRTPTATEGFVFPEIPLTMTISELKKELRRKVRRLKTQLSPVQRAEAAKVLADKALANPDVASAENVLSFWPMPDEIDIVSLNLALRNMGKNVYLPIMVGDDLQFRLFRGVDELIPDPDFGILQPSVDAPLLPPEVALTDNLVILTPGIAFAPDGRRLGRGKGFYDRSFSDFPKAKRIGVGFSCQLFPDVPTDEGDVPLDSIILC